jgi:cytochrome c-type biogenesis protein CcmH/NrfG
VQLRQREGILLSIALFVLAGIAYVGIVGQQLTTWDDDGYISANPRVRPAEKAPHPLSGRNIAWAFTTDAMDNYHPLTWLSLMADTTVYGTKRDWGYKFTNVLMHATNAVLLFLALRWMTARTGSSFFVAALFALHPLHVESVAWASERKDVLSTLFVLLAMLAYLRYSQRGSLLYYGLMLLGYAASLLSKQTYVTFPILLLILDVWPLRRLSEPVEGETPLFRKTTLMGAITEKLLPLALALAAAAVVMSLQASNPDVQRAEFPLGQRLGNAVVSYGVYLQKMVAPFDLAFYYPFPEGGHSVAKIALYGGVVAAVSALVVVLGKNRPELWVGWLWYLVTLVPMIGVVQVGFQAYADRYTYFPLVGVFIMLVFTIADLVKGRPKELPGVVGMGLVVLVVCMGFTWRQVGTWRNTETLATHALSVNPDNDVALVHLGTAQQFKCEWDDAKKNFERAVKVNPNHYTGTFNLGTIYLAERKTDLAAKQFERAKEINPKSSSAARELGVIRMGQNQLDEAIKLLDEAVKLDPRDESARRAAAVAYGRKGDFDKAVELIGPIAKRGDENKRAADLLRRMQKKDPTADNRFRLQFHWPPEANGSRMRADQTMVLYTRRRLKYPQAVEGITKALELWPNNIEALFYLAGIHINNQQPADAIGPVQRILDLDPNNERALRLTGRSPSGQSPKPPGVRE